MKIVVVGDIVTDILAVHKHPLAAGSDTVARVRISGGGSAANTASWLAQSQLPVTIVGVVGDDDAGTARLGELTALGVVCAVRRTADAATGSVVVLSTGEERTMLQDRAANALLTVDDVDQALSIVDGGHLHLSGYVLFDPECAPAGRHALTTAAAKGMTTSVDAASAAPLARLGRETFLSLVRGTNLLFANEAEAEVLTGGGEVADLLEFAPGVVLKRGPDGADWAGSDGSRASVPASPAAAVADPTGAGDAFAAGFLGSWLADGDAVAALAAGARLGALAVSRFGGRP